ncbi:hypothetical protein RND81_08G098300 [Saponaria officinalis]|uniref:Uncharacterized protein n=1 Tax=Saponaria officinalis TaxID=3572 RepID=A0AAW1J682_SAPOF
MSSKFKPTNDNSQKNPKYSHRTIFFFKNSRHNHLRNKKIKSCKIIISQYIITKIMITQSSKSTSSEIISFKKLPNSTIAHNIYNHRIIRIKSSQIITQSKHGIVKTKNAKN